MLVCPFAIVIETRLAAFTFRSVEPLIAPSTAWMVVSPRFRAVASPTAVIEATAVLEELQVTLFEMSVVVPSEYVPIAVNGCNIPRGMDALAGVTAMVVNVALMTVSKAFPEIVPTAAVMVAVPSALVVASPPDAIVAVPKFEELQVAVMVTS
jgi:hypothetical protein